MTSSGSIPYAQGRTGRERSGAHWVVLKFGGTSVSSLERWDTIASVLRQRLEEGLRPLVVCSALSQVSNRLDALLADAVHERDLREPLAELRKVHHDLAGNMELDADDLLGEDLAELQRLLMGISLTRELTPRLRAQVMSIGEVLSTRLGAAWLSAQGLSTVWQDARNLLVAEEDGSLAPAAMERQYLSATCAYDFDPDVDAHLQSLATQVIVTQGFIARGPEGRTVLLGRGGSDTSAAYLAARIGAERLEIWTDVPGLFTANPARIKNARLLRYLGYAEAGELASRGAKVLHPRCLAPVRERAIPLHLRCTPRPDLPGTVIADDPARNRAGIKGVVGRQKMVIVDLNIPESWQRVGLIADIGAVFRDHGISIDMFSSSMTHVTLAVDPSANRMTESVAESLLHDLEPIGVPKLIQPTAAVSLVGTSIGDVLHVLGPSLQRFEHENVHLVSHAANDLSLTILVDATAWDRLVQQVHDGLFDGEEPADDSFGPAWERLEGTSG